ncbi:MAG: hypothetical protein ACRBB6_03085 [Neptuniibacter sp.]
MLKLNTERSFKAPVTVRFMDEDGTSQKGTFNAKFKVVSTDTLQEEENADKRLLDLVLLEVNNIELADASGNPLEGEALLEACKSDPSISTALVATYGEQTAKKNLKRT